MKIANVRVAVRLTAGFSLVLSFLVVLLLLSVSRMSEMQQRMRNIVNVNNVQSGLASTMYLTITERALALRNLILLNEENEIAIEVARIKAQAKKYADAEEKLGAMLARDTDGAVAADQLKLFDEIKKQAKLSEPYIQKGAELGLAKRGADAYQLLRFEFRPVQKKWWDLLKDLMAAEEKRNAQAIRDAEQSYETARGLMFGFSAAALLAGIAAAWLITRSLILQLGGEPQYAVEIANKIAQGDLSEDIAVAAHDRSSLLYAMSEMRQSLARIVAQVRNGTNSIADASGQIASGNADLSARTEQQAGSLEETASSMEQLTSTVRQNADNAREANLLAQSASDVAQRGGKAVGEVVATMGSINESSRRIVDIITVIDGIAFQTNILALNAAVEAARAGEQGRGFAVVASEVRSLAQRSAEAAKEIKLLIGDSVGRIENGARQVDEAGATMREIVEGIQRVAHIMNEIVSASQEQSSGIEQVNQAIIQMDDMTQQNSSLVEEAAAAATELQRQAAGLAGLVSTFKIHERPQAALTEAEHREGDTVVAIHAKVHPAKHPVPRLKHIKRTANAARFSDQLDE